MNETAGLDSESDHHNRLEGEKAVDKIIGVVRVSGGPIIGLVMVLSLWGYRDLEAGEKIAKLYVDPTTQVAPPGGTEGDSANVKRRTGEVLQVLSEQEAELGRRPNRWDVFFSMLPWLSAQWFICGVLALVFPALEYISNQEHPHRDGQGSDEGERVRFLSRFALCALLSAGWVYVFSPGGIGSSAVDIYLKWRDPLRFSDIPAWMYHGENGPLLCDAFLGFYVYALTAWLSRFYSSDITRGLYLSLLKRGLVVLIFALVVSIDPTTGNPPIFSRLAIFLAGIFPQSVITLAKSKAGEKALFLDDKSHPLTEMSSVSVTYQTRLEEEGITSVSDLAHSNLLVLAQRTSFSRQVLARWCDEALLLSHVGPDKFDKLKLESISSATELVHFAFFHAQRVADLEKRVELHNVKFLAESLVLETNFQKILEFYDPREPVQ